MRKALISILILFLFGCSSKKEISSNEKVLEGDLNIVATYIQMEFAEDPEEGNKSWFTLIVDKENFSGITIDSILFKPKNYILSKEFEGFTMKTNQVRLLLNKIDNSLKNTPYSSVIYYSKNNKHFYQSFFSPQLKEPLYLHSPSGAQ